MLASIVQVVSVLLELPTPLAVAALPGLAKRPHSDCAIIYALAVIEHGTRRVRVLAATEHPVQSRVVQQARKLLMNLEDAGTRVKFVLHARDASFALAFDAVFRAAGVRVIYSAAPGAANEFDYGTVDWQLPTGVAGPHPDLDQRNLMIVPREYENFYNTHRPHRALSQAAPLRPLPDCLADLGQFRVQRRDRAGGVIHEYRLVA